MKITIEGPWCCLNSYINAERTNRFMAAKLKKDEMERMMWMIPKDKIEGKINLTFQAFVKNKKKDVDNLYMLFTKFFLDSLVKLEVIPNDGQANINRIIFEPVLIDTEERMIVTIENA